MTTVDEPSLEWILLAEASALDAALGQFDQSSPDGQNDMLVLTSRRIAVV